ncbi:MAG: hypothetical protein R2875_12560 [Desulfobacterales bacterium]
MTIWMLVDISIKQFNTTGEKVAWWLITLTPFSAGSSVCYLDSGEAKNRSNTA